MSIRTFHVCEAYDTFYEKVCRGFTAKQRVTLTVIEDIDPFSEHRSGRSQQTNCDITVVLLSHEDDSFFVGAFIESDIYVTITATATDISFQLMQ